PSIEWVLPAYNIGVFLPLTRPRKRTPIQRRNVLDTWDRFLEDLELGRFDDEPHTIQGAYANVGWFSPDWIPVFDNIQGDFVFIDTNPPGRGKSGQLIDWTRGFGPTGVIAKSFHALLERLANDIERGRYEVRLSKDKNEKPFAATVISKTYIRQRN